MTPEFAAFPKIARLSRDCFVTEKIDGRNAQVLISEDGEIHAGSRSRWITPGKGTDNYGFAAWVEKNREDLLKLGPGIHYGEWWGSGIQRAYGFKSGERFFSLFNVGRWSDPAVRPKCCGVVPVLYRGPFDTNAIAGALHRLSGEGSVAAPGYMDPEGIVVFHSAAGVLFKKTIKGDEQPKTAQQ